MSSEPSFRCPVCRATQTVRATCRRCQADLQLVQSAYQRLDYLKTELAAACARQDRERERQLAAELRWLAPRR